MSSTLPCLLNFDSLSVTSFKSLTKTQKKQITKLIKQRNIFKNMLITQSQNRWYNANILFRKERIKVLFGVIQKTAEIMEFNLNTYCLTIHLFDALAAKFPLERNEMLPIALVCMQLASKVTENQGKVIDYKDLNDFIYNYGVDYFLRIEQTIMEHLDFKINLTSPNVILTFLIKKFVSDEQKFFGPLANDRSIKEKYLKFILNIHLITLVDYEFYRYSSLAVAASIISFSRILLGMDPLPNYIADFIGISADAIKDCLKMIYENYSINFVQTVFNEIDEEINEQVNEEIDIRDGSNVNGLIQNSSSYFLNSKFQEELITTLNSNQDII